MEAIITHGLISEAKTGQNGGLNPSSIKMGENLPRSKVAQSIIASDPVLPTAGESFQIRKIDATPIKPAHSMHNPNTSPAQVPASRGRDTGGQRGALGCLRSRQGKK